MTEDNKDVVTGCDQDSNLKAGRKTTSIFDDMRGPYTLVRAAQHGILPDGRSKIGKTIRTFRKWLQAPFSGRWNTLQEARLQIAVPWIVLFFSMEMIDHQNKIRKDFCKATTHLERLIKDISYLADKSPSDVPNLQEYLRNKK